MTTDGWRVIDERARPTLRERIGHELVGADAADFAVARIRLAALDLTGEELAGEARWRVLLGELDAATLLEAAEGGGAVPGRRALAGLRAFAGSGRLRVRSAGIGAWRPDFAVIRTPRGAACALGAIYFGRPPLTNGPSFTVLTRDAGTVRVVADRFEELWARSHDVLPAIVDVLERIDGVGSGVAAGGG